MYPLPVDPIPIFSTYIFLPKVNGYVDDVNVPSRVRSTTLVPLVNERFLILIPFVLLVATILGLVSYKELVFLSNSTSETEVPCNFDLVIISSLTCPVTLSITTTLGGSK